MDRSRHQGYGDNSDEVEPAGELVERHAAGSTVVPQPGQHQLAADRVVLDLLRGELLGVE